MKPFIRIVGNEIEKARVSFPPIHSWHEAYTVILEEVLEFQAEVFKKARLREPTSLAKELMQIAAMAQRAAEDCGMSGTEKFIREVEGQYTTVLRILGGFNSLHEGLSVILQETRELEQETFKALHLRTVGRLNHECADLFQVCMAVAEDLSLVKYLEGAVVVIGEGEKWEK